MCIVGAFLWKKSPSCSISTVIYDDETMKIIRPACNLLFPESYLRFRTTVNKFIKHFFEELQSYHHQYDQPVRLEYKIVFHPTDIPYLKPAWESKYVYKIFFYWYKKSKKKIKDLRIAPQLRQKLSGRTLQHFNRSLRKLNLVSRKINTRFEYTLWTVALHVTASNYEQITAKIKNKIMKRFWAGEDIR